MFKESSGFKSLNHAMCRYHYNISLYDSRFNTFYSYIIIFSARNFQFTNAYNLIYRRLLCNLCNEYWVNYSLSELRRI